MKALVFFALLLCTLINVINGACEHRVFASCECEPTLYLGREQYVLNCTDIGFTNVSVLTHIPEETQVLIFTGNNFPELPWNLFGTAKNLSKLRVIDMSNNKIKLIHGKSFHHVSAVERLILNHNQISISSIGTINSHHPRVFSNFERLLELHMTDAFADEAEDLAADLHDIFINSELKQLRKIHLEQNGIIRFKDPKIFCDLPNIMDLYLANNKLEAIEFEISCLPHLRFIDLEKNSINSISVSDMERLDAVVRRGQNLTIDLGGNPLYCGPELEAFYSWLECSRVQVRNRGKLKCIERVGNKSCSIVVTPSSCHARPLASVHLTDHRTQSHSIPLLILLVLLVSFSANAYFIYFRLFPHDPIGIWFKNLSRAFTTSVHYTKQGNLDDL